MGHPKEYVLTISEDTYHPSTGKTTPTEYTTHPMTLPDLLQHIESDSYLIYCYDHTAEGDESLIDPLTRKPAEGVYTWWHEDYRWIPTQLVYDTGGYEWDPTDPPAPEPKATTPLPITLENVLLFAEATYDAGKGTRRTVRITEPYDYSLG